MEEIVSNDFVTADLHLSHLRVVKDQWRPFTSIKDMDDLIIQCWNEVIDDDDIVYVVGDFALTNASLEKEYIKVLKGNKYLVRGNHDQRTSTWYRRNGFIDVQDYYILGKYFLCHYPLINVNKLYLKNKYDMFIKAFEDSGCEYVVHGHIHDGIVTSEKNRINVGVDIVGYYPVLLNGIESTI